LDGTLARHAARYRAKNPASSWGRDGWRLYAPRECERCTADLTTAERTICSDCSRIRRREREWRKEGWRHQVERDPYTLEEIAGRDGYQCQICIANGKRRWAKVDMSLKVPHLRAATIDHIVPRSMGGDDTRVNVQLAHFSCNSQKHAKYAGQQLLFG